MAMLAGHAIGRVHCAFIASGSGISVRFVFAPCSPVT